MKRKPTQTTPALPHADTMEVASGKTLSAGQEFTVKGEGRFRFHYQYTPDGSITAYGPVGKQTAQWRSFPKDTPVTIHRNTTPKHTEKSKS